jgi:putative membrane protein
MIGRTSAGWRALAMAAGGLALAAALMPPLHELVETRFSAHMGQHQLLMLVAAPLLALARPDIIALWLLPRSWRARVRWLARTAALRGTHSPLAAPIPIWIAAAAIVWLWHVPALFQAAVEHAPLHALEHLTLFASALASWWVALHGGQGTRGYGLAVLWLFATAMHTSLLGALLTMSPRVWYPLYIALAGGRLAGLEDQQLAGLIMWIPSGTIHTAAGLALFAAWLHAAGRRAAHRLRARRVSGMVAVAFLAVLIGGCGGVDQTPASVTGGDPGRGRRLVTTYGCQVCHHIPGVPGAHGTVGPPLDGMALRSYVAGRLANNPENLIRWIRTPQSVGPQTAMPDMGVTEQDGRDLAAFLYTLR